MENGLPTSNCSQSSADDSCTEGNERMSPTSQPLHRWSDFLAGKTTASFRPRLDPNRGSSASPTLSPYPDDTSCSHAKEEGGSIADSCAGRVAVEEVDSASASDGAAASPCSDADLLDDAASPRRCAGGDEDGLLGPLEPGAGDLDDDVLAIDAYGAGPDRGAPAAMACDGPEWAAAATGAACAGLYPTAEDDTGGDAAVRRAGARDCRKGSTAHFFFLRLIQ